jgi:predicted transcriptional regulator
MDHAIEQLIELGFGQYEAQAYTALLGQNPLNGYELAKASGIPRANIYGILQKLEERGAIVRLDTEGGTRYAPVLPDELIQRLRSRLQASLESARQSLDGLKAHVAQDRVWNARGYPVLIQQARALIEAAQEQILVAASPEEAPALSESLEGAQARGVQVTTLCMAGCPQECGACRGKIYRYHLAPAQEQRYLVLVPDESEVLAGQIGPSQEDAMAVRTRQKLLVDLARWHIRNSIALAAILVDLGDRLDSLLAPETRAVLGAIGPGGPYGSWLEYMNRMLNQVKSEQEWNDHGYENSCD